MSYHDRNLAHPIVLGGLKRLYPSMRASGKLRVQFEHRHPNNGARFTVVFLADAAPFQLIVVAKGPTPLVIVTTVLPGFRVSPWIESGVKVIAALKGILGVIPCGQTSFKLTHFFKEVAASAPAHVGATDDARPLHQLPAAR